MPTKNLTFAILIICHFLLCNVGYAQTHCNDTIAFASSAYKLAKSNGVRLVDYTVSSCDSNLTLVPNTLITKQLNDSTYIFKVTHQKNCCGGSLAHLEVNDTQTWNFKIQNPRFDNCEVCFCHCVFTLHFTVITTVPLPSQFLLNNTLLVTL
jgi:hypothetical protein